MYDIATYEPGAGYDDNPDTGANPGGPQPEATPAAAPTTPVPAGDRFGHLRGYAPKNAPALAAQPAVEPEGEAPPGGEQQTTDYQPHALVVPEFLPASEMTDERSAFLSEFSHVTAQAGVSSEIAQSLVDAYVDGATMLNYVWDGQHASADDAQATLDQLFGPEVSKTVIKSAQDFTRGKEALRTWLDSTGVGNDPAAVWALANAHLSRMPADEAQHVLKETMATDAYRQGNREVLLAVQALARAAHRGERSQDQILADAARAQVAKQERAAGQQAAAVSTQDARSQMAKLMEKGSPLYEAGSTGHADAVRQFHALAAKLQ